MRWCAPASNGTGPWCNKRCRQNELARSRRPSSIGRCIIRLMEGRKMIGDVIVVGDLKLRDDADMDSYGQLGERMYSIVSKPSGFLSVKSFRAEDGEEITVFRFASEEALEAWRTHPDHVETMKRGHAEFYSSGFLQICRVIREVGPFKHN